MGLFDITPSFSGRRGYSKELYRTFEAQNNIAPIRLDAERKLQPFQTAQNLVNLDQFLTGTPEMEIPSYTYVPAVYRKKKEDDGGFFSNFFDPVNQLTGGGSMLMGGLFGGGGKGKELAQKAYWKPNGTTRRAAQRGFLDIYNNAIIPAMTEAQTKMRTADIADVQNLSPAMREALRTANPDAARLLDELDRQAQGDLQAGAALNASELRNIQQAMRAGQSARGMGFGPADNFQEALQSLNYGRGLQQQRRAFAGDVLAQLQGFYGNPFERVLGRNSTAGQAPGVGGQGIQASRLQNYINPESAYAQDVNSWNAQAQQMIANAGAENNAALLGGIISAVGNIAGGAAGAAI